MSDRVAHEIKSRRDYRKPRLRRIELATEEVLGAGCKFYGADAKFVAGATRISCGVGQGCAANGT